MHSLLVAAHDSAEPSDRPPPPYHAGVDANPQLGSFGYAGVAIFMAEALAPAVTKAERARSTAWLDRARAIYDRHARGDGALVKRGTRRQLKVLSKSELAAWRPELAAPPGLAPAPASAHTAIVAAYDIEVQGGGSDVTAGVRRTIVSAVKSLPATAVQPFLLELDRRLLREELRAMLVRLRDPRAAKVSQCVWRAASGRARQGRASGAQVTHWVGRLDDGGWLLVAKLGPRWSVVEGERDEVLATVPDVQMASAVRAVMGALPR